MALNWKSVSANMLIIFSSSVKCFSFSGVLKISLNRTLKYMNFYHNPFRQQHEECWRKLLLAWGTQKTMRSFWNKKQNPQKTNLVRIVLWSGPRDLVMGIISHGNPVTISHYWFALCSRRWMSIFCVLVGNKNCKRTNYYILLCNGRTASLLQLLKTKKVGILLSSRRRKIQGKACLPH